MFFREETAPSFQFFHFNIAPTAFDSNSVNVALCDKRLHDNSSGFE